MGKTALVTGGAKRLGKSCALALAHRGVHILLHYFHSNTEAEETRREIREAGVKCTLIREDLSDPEGGRHLFEKAVTAAGAVDILVNSASAFPEDTMNNMTWDSLTLSALIHGYAPLILTRGMAEQGREGTVINILDARGTDYDRAHFSYHMGKRMLLSFTRTTALEFAPLLRVNGIAPGVILPPEGAGEDYREKLKESTPLKKTGNPDHITETLLFLCRNDFITGQVIYVDGGRNIRGSVYG